MMSTEMTKLRAFVLTPKVKNTERSQIIALLLLLKFVMMVSIS
jgi:hypothetical protein